MSNEKSFTLPSFKNKSVEEIISIVIAIPVSCNGIEIEEVDFSKTDLFELNWDRNTSVQFMLPVNGIIAIINAIPNHIKHLNLSDCNVAYANTGSNNNGRLKFDEAEALYSALGNPRFHEITFGVIP